MILTTLGHIGTFLILFFFVFLPIVFIITFFNTPSKSDTLAEEISPSVNNEPVQERISPEIYRTVKKEAGSYEVHAPNGKFAVVIKMPYVNEGTFWAVALAAKDGKRIDRIKTKKEAVAAAIELLKEK